MSSSFSSRHRNLVLGLVVASCFAAVYLHLRPTADHHPSRTPDATLPVATAAAEPHETPLAAVASPSPPVADAPNPAAAPPRREMDPALNPYAASLRGPGKSKRAWDAAYIESFLKAGKDEPVRFELTGGVMARGRVKILQIDNGEVTYVSGELNAPEPGKFFILKPPAGGKAGKAVAVVEFPGSRTAFRVEPTGADGAPELWQRQLNEVVCERMAEIDPARIQAAEASANETEYIVPLNPGQVTDYVPSYNANIISLQSFPGSNAVMLLDFAGGYTPHWGGVTYARPAISNSDIKDIWKRVAEDYLPFNINVTTDIKVFQAAPAASRQRCCYTTTPVTAAGVAYFGSWNWGNDAVCWSVYFGKAGAEVGAHEVGHTLGLAHQGQDIPDGAGGTSHNEYFAGHGSGETGWAPIMGAGYYQPVTTWAKGEFEFASQPQDELATITTANNNVHFRADDTGATLASSRYLDVNADSTVSAEGVIEQSGDTDAFQFTTTGGAVSLTGRSVAPGDWGDLALMATLANSSDTVIATSNVQNSTSATITTTLTAGTYTFRLTGTGKGTPTSDGFTSYASLGYYSVSGNVAGARQPTRLSVAEHAATNTVVGTVSATNPNGSPLVYTIASGNTGTTFSVDNIGVVRVANNTLLDYYVLAANPALYAARFELFVNITNTNNAAFNETNRRVLVDVRKLFPPVPVGLTAQVDTGLRIRLSWVGGQEATSYNVKRSTTRLGPYTTIGTTVGSATDMAYTDSGLTGGVTYYYVVSAVNANGETVNSAEAGTTAQTVLGSGFELPVLGSGNHAYNPQGGIWTFSGSGGNGSGIVVNGSAFGNPNSPEGVQAAFVQSYGTITQTLSGFTPGAAYTVTYSAAQRSGAAQHGGESWNVTVDGNVIQTNTPGPTSYRVYSTTFTATATTHTLAFVGTDLAGGDNTVFLDNVQVAIVSPPIANFSFETPVTGNYQYNPSGGSWTFNGSPGSGSGVLANGSGFGNTSAPLGAQAAFVQGLGTITQTLSGFTPGKIYTLSYQAAQRPSNASGESWNVKIDGSVIQTNTPGGTAYAACSVNFTATAATHTLSFVGTNLAGGDNTVFLDNISLTTPLQPVAAAVTLSGPANGAVFVTPGTVSLSANVMVNGNVIDGVQFFADNGTLLGTDSTAPYTFDWVDPTSGWHAVYARVLFNTGSSADSGTTRIAIINTNQNFGFELAGIGNGNHQYNPTGGSWTFVDGGSGLIANGSAFGNPNAPEGTQAAFVQRYGTLTQTLSGFVPGMTYAITYAAAQRSGAAQHGGESWDVTIDGNVIQSNSPGGTSYAIYSSTFVATSATHTLSFVGTDLAGGDNTVFIDNVLVGLVAPSIANFSFETPGTGNFQYKPTGGTWTFTGASGNGSGILTNGSGFGNPNAPQGSQAAFIQTLGSISQTLSGFVPGRTYQISYSAAQRSGPSQHGGESWEVRIDNAVIQSNTPGSASYAPYTATFVASSTSHTLTFVGTNQAGGDNTVFIDYVSLVSPLQLASPAPAGLAATAGNAQVSLSWGATSGATSYNIKRATVSGGPYTTLGNVTTTTYLNTGLTNGTTYHYVVTALNNGGESGISSQASATPAAPTFAISSHAFNFNTHQLQLTFSSEVGAMYKITSSTDLVNWSSIVADNIPGNAGQTTLSVSFPQSQKRFFRVEKK